MVLMENNLNLYVWEDVLRDYSSGIVFALAESPQEARTMIIEQIGDFYEHEFKVEPQLVTEKKVFIKYGGG
jgi:hypothetical protein